MRTDSIAIGAAGIVLAIITFFIGHASCPPPPPDGNPIGFRLTGNIQVAKYPLDNCTANTCRLTFDLTTNEVTAANPAVACESDNCFRFNNANSTSNKMAVGLKFTEADGWHTYYDYVDGTVSIVTNGRPHPQKAPHK